MWNFTRLSIIGNAFCIFINDLLENLNSNDNRSVGIAYADDLNLIVKGENLNEVREVLESKINLLDNWYNANRISVNAKKTELKIFDKTPNKVLKFIHLDKRLTRTLRLLAVKD